MKKNIFALLILLILFVGQLTQAAEIIRYVDTASGGGDGTTAGTGTGGVNAYASLAACIVAEACDLTDNGGDTMVIHCNRTSGDGAGGADDGLVDIDTATWTTSATCTLTIMADDFPADGIYDSTAYLVSRTDGTVFDISENYVRLQNLQIITTTTWTTVYGIYVNDVAAGGSDIRIDSCIIQGNLTGTAIGYGININDSDATVSVFNNIIYGWISGDNPGDTDFEAIHAIANTTLKIYNNTIFDSYYGIKRSGGTVTAINNALFNNTNDLDGTITTNYNATDQGAGEGTNGLDISGTWDSTCFTAPEASPPDVSVQDASSPVYEASEITYTDDNSVPQVDIIDTARNTGAGEQTSIGAFEYSSGIVIPVFDYHYRYH